MTGPWNHHCTFPMKMYKGYTFHSLLRSNLETHNIRVVLHAANKVHGSFRIFRTYGFGDKELKFKVLDTTETIRPQPVLLDLGTVVGDASFEFTAGRSGDYLLVFENNPGFSDSNSQKEIQLTFEITDSREDATLFAGDRKPTAS